VAFPWEGAPWLQNTKGWGAKDPDGVHNGVGPAQTWWTTPSANTFEFRFGNKNKPYGLYGCPTEFDGHVPQVFATWVNGLTPGTYYIRVWINGFVQTDINGAPMDYVVNVAEQEWAGDIYVPIDVQLSGKINKTIHFQSGPGSLAECSVGGPDPWRFVIVEARDAKGTLVAFNFTQVKKTDTSVTIELNGFGMAGPVLDDGWDSQEVPWHWGSAWLVRPVDMKFSLYRYRHIRDYGLMPGTYKIYVYVRGFVQQEWEWASVSLSGQTTKISNHMYRGAGINVTVWSIDWQHPKVARPWQYNGERIEVSVYNDENEKLGRIKYWNASIGRTGTFEAPVQDAGFTSIPNSGWNPVSSKLKFNGSTALEEKGPDETIGAYTLDASDEASTLWLSTMVEAKGFLFDSSQYRDGRFNTKIGLETGTYRFKVNTYGYVFKYPEKYTVYVGKGQQADISLEIVIGVSFMYQVAFKREGLFEPLPYDTVVNLEIYNSDGKLVASSWHGWGSVKTGYGVPAGTLEIQGVIAGDYNKTYGYGVEGYPDYQRSWFIKASTWYTYRDGARGIWHPMVPGLLLGAGGIHLSPYGMGAEIVIPNVPLGGAASVQFELDQRALIAGQVAAFTESNELRTVSWASVMARGPGMLEVIDTFDGRYEMFLPRGEYQLIIEEWPGEAGHRTSIISVRVPDGGVIELGLLSLERSDIAIPEFQMALLPSLTALWVGSYLLRRGNRKTEMKI
jgi:hypothetical protein